MAITYLASGTRVESTTSPHTGNLPAGYATGTLFVAQIVKPQARVLAESRGFRWVEVDYDELRGLRADELRLF